MNKAKALLDSLMGPSRDKAKDEKSGEEFKDKSVCKHFLVGFCPDTLLAKYRDPADLKERLGEPPAIREERLRECKCSHMMATKKEFEGHKEHEKLKKEYEEKFSRRLQQRIELCDGQYNREKRKCREPEQKINLPAHLKDKAELWESERKRYLELAEVRGNNGDVTGAQEAAQEAKDRQWQINGMTEDHTYDFPGEGCCDACGVRYLKGPKRDDNSLVKVGASSRDATQWEDEHKDSKLHKLWVEMRSKLKELQLKMKEQEPPPKEERKDERRDDRGDDRGDRGGKSREDRDDRDRGARSRSRDRGRDDRDRGGGRDDRRGRDDRDTGRDDRRGDDRRGRNNDDRGGGGGRDGDRGGGRDRNYDRRR